MEIQCSNTFQNMSWNLQGSDPLVGFKRSYFAFQQCAQCQGISAQGPLFLLLGSSLLSPECWHEAQS